MSSLRIEVNGIPAAQGSKRHVGRGIMVESSKAVSPWREAVRAETQREMGDLPPREGALWVEVTFRLPRPKGHMGKRGLRPSAPRFPATRPDLDKLCRAVLDGLTSGGAYGDDAQVTVLTAEKVYASETRAPGCTIRVGRMA